MAEARGTLIADSSLSGTRTQVDQSIRHISIISDKMPKSDYTAAKRQKDQYYRDRERGLVVYKRKVKPEWKPALDKLLNKLRKSTYHQPGP